MATTHHTGYRVPGLRTMIHIEAANIFDQQGLKIVHCPTQFETHPDVICPHSLIEQLVSKSREAGCDIDAQIDTWCHQNAHQGTRDQRLPHRQISFPIGKLCPLTIGGDEYYLAAFNYSSSRKDLRPLGVQDYIAFWRNIWSNLQTLGNISGHINVPIPGGVHVDINNPHFEVNQKIGIIASTFLQFIQTSGRTYTLRICLYGDDAQWVNIDHWYDAILPYLYDMSFLNMQIAAPAEAAEVTNYQESAEGKALAHLYDDDAFLSHLHEIIVRLDNANGNILEQNIGNKHHTFAVSIDREGLEHLEQLLRQNPDTLHMFSEIDSKVGTYSHSKMAQLLLFIENRTHLFGQLNRKSYVSIIHNDRYASPQTPEGYQWITEYNIDNLTKFIGNQNKKQRELNRQEKQLLPLIPTMYLK